EEKISIVEEANALYGKNILIGDKEDGEPNNYIIDGEIVNEIVLPIDAQIAAIVLDYALSIKDIVSEYMRLLGKLTFSDALFYLRDMLKEDAKKEGKLIRHIQNRHAYYLIDEFQDTSPTQSEIFFYLASIEPKEDWMECKPRSGSLFIVGDPKQSIYRFRGADVTSYLRIRKMFEEGGFGKVLLLTRNFRSTNVIRKDFNTFFTGYLEDKEGLQKAYAHVPIDEEIVRDEEVDDFSLKQIQAYEKEREGKENILEGSYIYDIPYYWRNKDNQDPILIANIIEQLVGRSENRIVVKGKDGYVTRHAKYSDFMIITPSTSQIPLIVTELKKRNIPVFVEGKIVYSECPSLVAMTHLYRAACQPKDIHLFLAKYLSDCEIEEESFREFLYQHTSDTPVSLFVNLMEEYKLYEHVQATNLEYLYYAIQLMRERELDGRILSRKEALAFLEKLLYSRNKEFERYMQFDQEGDRVHIANLHKVKGLERPIVILSGGKSSDFDVVSSFDYSERKPKTYLFGIEKKNNDTGNSEVYLCLGKEEEKEKELLQSEEERKRLIYVAATRAGNVLITARMLDKEGELVPNMMWKDIAEHIHRYIDEAIVIKERELQMDIDREEEDIPLTKWEKEDVLPKEISTYRIVNPSKEKHQLSSKDEEPIVDILEDTKPIQTLEEMRADLFGTLVHAFMEALVNAKGKINQKALIERLIHEYGAEKEIYETYLEEVAKVICEEGGYKQEGRNIESDIFKTLMDADEVYCEVPFCYKRKGKEKDEIVHGIMDVVYRIGESWHIVDYKTDYDAKGLEKRHSAQMRLYEEALKETMGIEAKAKLYHIGIKKAMLEG
ncbi:MAG: UvrD-helicase domain-containing protein, partial [Solobacterium sp.]|nr:UvrD-helicase domain-containing protein [Solobacterium sp.]